MAAPSRRCPRALSYDVDQGVVASHRAQHHAVEPAREAQRVLGDLDRERLALLVDTMLTSGITWALPLPRSPPRSSASSRAMCSGVIGSPRRTPQIDSTRSIRWAMRSESFSPMTRAETTGITVLASLGICGSTSFGALSQRLRAPSALTRTTSNPTSAWMRAISDASSPANRPRLSAGCANAIFLSRARASMIAGNSSSPGAITRAAFSVFGKNGMCTVAVMPTRPG